MAAAIACVVLAAFGCTTTHQLGRGNDPAIYADLERATTGAETYALVEALPGASSNYPGDRVRALTPQGIVVAPVAVPPTLVPLDHVRSVSTYDRMRGARDGALLVGIPAFVVATVLSGLAVYTIVNCSDGCSVDHPQLLVLGIGAVAGFGGAFVGGAIGGALGHEDRYVIEAP